jgi:membrane carboxypeptidase/penicillin-binding protein PbpC
MKRMLIFPLAGLLAWCITACDSNSNVAGEGRGLSPQAYHLSPSSAVLGNGDANASFTAVGGSEPFSWSVSDGALGQVSSNSTSRTVNYQRTVGVEGVNTLTAIDANGNRAQASIVQQSLLITPAVARLAEGELSISFSAVGGHGPFRWSVVNSRIGAVGATTGRSALYTRKTAATGSNTIRVQDAEGSVAEAVVEQ